MTTWRCPFLAAVARGDLTAADALARSGPEPAEPPVVDVLVEWAQLMVQQGRADP